MAAVDGCSVLLFGVLADQKHPFVLLFDVEGQTCTGDTHDLAGVELSAALGVVHTGEKLDHRDAVRHALLHLDFDVLADPVGKVSIRSKPDRDPLAGDIGTVPVLRAGSRHVRRERAERRMYLGAGDQELHERLQQPGQRRPEIGCLQRRVRRHSLQELVKGDRVSVDDPGDETRATGEGVAEECDAYSHTCTSFL